MHPASLSVKVFGAYVSVTGLGLLLAPGPVLSLLGVPAPTEVWIRVLGALAVVLGYYYWICGTAGAVPFIRASVLGRLVFAGLCIVLVVTGAAPVQLLVFVVVDILGAVWTARALKQPIPSGGAAA